MNEDLEPKGTVVLAYVFLVVFALYYFFNWKILDALWHVS